MKIAQKLLIIAGIIELLIGLMHFTWPFELIEYSEFSKLPDYGKDLIFLSSLAVGLCLSVFGFLTIYFAIKIDELMKPTWIYAITQGILWLVRLIFEILLPVRFKIYIINNPTNTILIGAFILILLYFIPVLLIRKTIKNATQQCI